VVMKSSTFWNITPCSPLKVNRHFKGTYHLLNWTVVSLCPPISYINQHFGKLIPLLATCFTLFSCLAYSFTLKMESTFSPKMLVDLQWTTFHYIPEDRTLHTTYSVLFKEMMSVSYRNFIKIRDIFKEIAILCFEAHLKATFFFKLDNSYSLDTCLGCVNS
jgi:hypothetical protein